MASIRELQDRIAHRRQLTERLTHARAQLAAAEAEHVTAIHTAHQGGLSIRQIAEALQMSRSRVHQLLHAPDAR